MFGDGTVSKDGVPKIVHDTFLLGQPLAFVGSGKITNRVPQIVCLNILKLYLTLHVYLLHISAYFIFKIDSQIKIGISKGINCFLAHNKNINFPLF